MNLRIEGFAPGQSGLGYLDVLLTFVKFVDDLGHSDSVTAAKEIPKSELGGRGVRAGRKAQRRKRIDSEFHMDGIIVDKGSEMEGSSLIRKG
jgi:hypothetical protein